MLKNLVLSLLFLATSLMAQDAGFNVKILKLLENSSEQYHFPRFNPDDSKVFFTESNYRGLYYYDLGLKNIIKLTDKPGAGYMPVFSQDGQTVIYRTDTYKKKRRYSSIVSQSIENAQIILHEKEQRDVRPPLKMNSGTIVYSIKDQFNQIKGNDLLKPQEGSGSVAMIEKSKKILILTDGIPKTIQPNGERFYLWPSISPDGTKLLYTVAGTGTFVSDLDGNILAELGYGNAPQWSPDGNWIVFMRDYDDGHRYTESEIYIIKSDGSSLLQLTSTPEVIEMFPQWSHSGDKIVCSGINGSLYLITLEQK